MSSDESTSSAEEFGMGLGPNHVDVKMEPLDMSTDELISSEKDVSQSSGTNNVHVNELPLEMIMDESTSSEEELSQCSVPKNAKVNKRLGRSILLSPSLLKRRYSKHLSSTEKLIAINIFKYIQSTSVTYPVVKEVLKQTGQIMGGVSEATIANVLREYKKTGELSSPDRTNASANSGILNKLDNSTLSAISRKIQTSFKNDDIPTLNDVLKVVNDDAELPSFSRTTMYNLLKKLNFTCSKRIRRGILKKDIAKMPPR